MSPILSYYFIPLKHTLLVVVTVFIFIEKSSAQSLSNEILIYYRSVSELLLVYPAKCQTKFYWPDTTFARCLHFYVFDYYSRYSSCFVILNSTVIIESNEYMMTFTSSSRFSWKSGNHLLLILCVPFFSVGHRFLVAICSKLSSRRRILGHSLAAL